MKIIILLLCYTNTDTIDWYRDFEIVYMCYYTEYRHDSVTKNIHFIILYRYKSKILKIDNYCN